jgi:hypothetical protein
MFGDYEMILTLSIIVLIFLAIVSVIDLKFKQVPSIFLTGFILAVIIVNYNSHGLSFLFYGIASLVFALFLYEFDFIGGVADIKVIVIIGLMLNSIKSLFIFMILIMSIGIIYQGFFTFILKKEKGSEIPFLLSFFIVYIILILLGVVI